MSGVIDEDGNQWEKCKVGIKGIVGYEPLEMEEMNISLTTVYGDKVSKNEKPIHVPARTVQVPVYEYWPGCEKWPNINDLVYEQPSEEFPYGRDMCRPCARRLGVI